MLSKNDDVLHFRHDVHIDAAIVIFTGGRQALPVFYGRQYNGIRRDGAFDAVHAERHAKTR
jgi:hypothetical protein